MFCCVMLQEEKGIDFDSIGQKIIENKFKYQLWKLF